MESSGQPGQGSGGSTGGAGSGGGSSWQSGGQQSPGSSSPPSWQSTPQQTPATTGGAGWEKPAATGTAVPGTAGFFYADVPNRFIALIIDSIILAVISVIVNIIVSAIVGPMTTVNPNPTDFNNLVAVNWGSALVSTILNALVSAAYFVWTWTSWRASPGQRVLGMQVGNETDGASLTMNQAITRWALLFLPGSIGGVLFGLPALGLLVALAAFVWWIVLLVTTAQSPTKQGLHDRYAHTVVVKAGRSAS